MEGVKKQRRERMPKYKKGGEDVGSEGFRHEGITPRESPHEP